MRLFKWEVLKILRDWKVRILLVALLLFLATYSTLYQDRTIKLPVEEAREEYHDTQRLFHAIPEAHFETETGQDIYDRLARQQQILGMQRFILSEKEGNTVEGLEEIVSDYVDQGIEMTENQLHFHEVDDFESQTLLLSFIPGEVELENRLKFLNYLKKNDVAIDWNPMSPSLVLYSLINILAGVFIYIVAAVFGADRFSRDQEYNWSITQGIPLTWKSQWRMRSVISWVLIWIAILIGLVVSYIINRASVDTGTLLYPGAALQRQPTGVHQHNGIHYARGGPRHGCELHHIEGLYWIQLDVQEHLSHNHARNRDVLRPIHLHDRPAARQLEPVPLSADTPGSGRGMG